jgi:hypothetical protein
MSAVRKTQGQVLVIFAGGLFGFIALMALVIDLSMVHSLQQSERSLADAASLAGAQDLQSTTSRAVSTAAQARARQHALASVADALGVAMPACATNIQVIDCPIGSYLVSVKTPSPSVMYVVPDHAVQVTVRNPSVPLTFARVLGQRNWNVGITSVAGLRWATNYAVVTLRPPDPNPNGLDQNRQDINVNGSNTRINIHGGDIGSNTSVFTNSGGLVTLDTGYLIYHMDDIFPDPWNKVNGEPVGQLITQLIPDPNYRYASPAGLPDFADQTAGVDPLCALAPAGAVPTGAVCYKPGNYNDTTHPFKDTANTDVSYLEPGRYFFNGGLDISGTLIGGNVTHDMGVQGVILVVPYTKNVALNNAVKIRLNAGPDTCNADSCRSGPALDADGTELRTPEKLILTVEVQRIPACFGGLVPLNNSCDGSNVLHMPGNGDLTIGGVVYGPGDNIVVNGDNSNSVGTIGLIVGWTITYSGGAQLNQTFPGGESVGVLHLDAACSGGGNPCTP